MEKIIDLFSYRMAKASNLQEATEALANANAALAEAQRNTKFIMGNYYQEPLKYTDGDPLQREAIKIIRRTSKTVTFLYIPRLGMDEEICKVMTRKVHPGNYGEWIQINKCYPTISASDLINA